MDNVRLESRHFPRITLPGSMDAAAETLFLHRIAVENTTSVTETGLPAGVVIKVSEDGRSAEMRGPDRWINVQRRGRFRDTAGAGGC